MSDYTPFPVWPRPSDEGGGVTSHGALTGRDSADQHPTSAITGLDAALAESGGYINFLFTADALTGVGDDGGATYTQGVSIEFPAPFSDRAYVHNQPWIEVYQGDGTTTALYTGRLGGESMPSPALVVVGDDYTTANSQRETLWLRPGGGDEYAPYEPFPKSVYSAVKTDDYTVTGRDFGGVIEMDAATDKTITLPSGGTYGFPQLALGVFVEFHNAGTGTLYIDHGLGIEFSVGGTTVPTVTVLPGGSVKARCRVFDSTSEWAFTGDNEVWLWDGVTDYLPTYGARRFVGPNDPAGEGFTLSDGDQWKDTSA